MCAGSQHILPRGPAARPRWIPPALGPGQALSLPCAIETSRRFISGSFQPLHHRAIRRPHSRKNGGVEAVRKFSLSIRHGLFDRQRQFTMGAIFRLIALLHRVVLLPGHSLQQRLRALRPLGGKRSTSPAQAHGIAERARALALRRQKRLAS